MIGYDKTNKDKVKTQNQIWEEFAQECGYVADNYYTAAENMFHTNGTSATGGFRNPT